MRTVIVPTDFSNPSKNAARFALNLAIGLKADLHLCHAYHDPVESPIIGEVPWTLLELPDVKKDAEKALKKLAKALETKENIIQGDNPGLFKPAITWSAEQKHLVSLIDDKAKETKAMLVVMGMTGSGKLNRLLFGSSSLKMINESKYPLLIVPHHHRYRKMEKIAFATDLNRRDQKTARSVARFAKYFDAELMVSYVTGFSDLIDEKAYLHKKEEFIKNIDGKVTYLPIEVVGVNTGLGVLRYKDVDLVVMGHERKSFFERVTTGSHSATLARKVQMPLMIIPEGAPLLF
ncbi:universal stress protein [Kaistella faecalis]|uniref:universal stress protein n=1 Tax=Kaistella faecalis TaxID=2852098 RepID=UPI001C492BC0|nr:universal stress protein [Chryseobacterium faecale]UFK97761.1 universal stress protein [Chryseobacterium faecale]